MAVSPERRAEIIDAVIAGISRGTPLTVVVEAMQAARPSVYRWLSADPEVQAAIGYARDLGYDWIAHECLEIADDGRNDWMERQDRDGEVIGWQVNGEHVLRSKLRIETRLKLLAKWDPRRYGDTKHVEIDAEVNVTQRHVVDSRSLTDGAVLRCAGCSPRPRRRACCRRPT